MSNQYGRVSSATLRQPGQARTSWARRSQDVKGQAASRLSQHAPSRVQPQGTVRFWLVEKDLHVPSHQKLIPSLGTTFLRAATGFNNARPFNTRKDQHACPLNTASGLSVVRGDRAGGQSDKKEARKRGLRKEWSWRGGSWEITGQLDTSRCFQAWWKRELGLTPSDLLSARTVIICLVALGCWLVCDVVNNRK